MPLRHRSAANRQAGSTVQPLLPMLHGNPVRVAANQWYAGTQGERTLKYIFSKFTSIADTEVKMSRRTDIQDVTLSFEAHGQLCIAQNSATHPGPFLSLVALNLKSRESKDVKQ